MSKSAKTIGKQIKPIIDVHKIRVGEIYLDIEGIARGVITLENAEETINDAMEIAEGIKIVCKGKICPVLSDVRNIKSVDREARVYLGKKENLEYTSAIALLIESSVSKVLANFFVKVNRPEIPTQVFTSEDAALAWLRGFLE